MRALVTGASGFIGRWVSRCAHDAGADVILAVRDARAFEDHGSPDTPRGFIAQVDLRHESEVDALLRDVRPHVTFSLAGYGVDRSERDAELARQLNAEAVEMLVNAVARYSRQEWRAVQLVHAGSALEYGAARGNLSETTTPRPTEVYGETKLAGSLALQERSGRGDVRAVVARLFTVYGPGEHDGRLLPTLLAASDGDGDVVLSSGEQRRDFTFVRDVAEGFVRLAATNAPTGWFVNLATGRLTSVRSFVEVAAGVLSIDRGRLRFGAVPRRPEEMQHEPVDIGRLRSLLGWVPPTSIEDGVRATLAWRRHQATEAGTPGAARDPGAGSLSKT